MELTEGGASSYRGFKIYELPARVLVEDVGRYGHGSREEGGSVSSLEPLSLAGNVAKSRVGCLLGCNAKGGLSWLGCLGLIYESAGHLPNESIRLAHDGWVAFPRG